jgi:hypothetical protein
MIAPFVVPLALAMEIHRCSPGISPDIMASIVEQESSRKWLAIRDDTANTSAYPPDLPSAYALAQADVLDGAKFDSHGRLAQLGHTIDVGLAGIDSVHFIHLGMTRWQIARTLVQEFDPCRNLAQGQAVLQSDYVRAVRSGRPSGIQALSYALYLYNGAGRTSWGYARNVIVRAMTYRVANPLPWYGAGPSLAALPMPDRPWPTDAAFVPVAQMAPVQTTPIVATTRSNSQQESAYAKAYARLLARRRAAEESIVRRTLRALHDKSTKRN